MSLSYQEPWDQSRYYDNDAMNQDWPTLHFEMPASNIDPSLVEKPHTSQQFNGMTPYLTDEKPYCQTFGQDFRVEGTAPWPVHHDHVHACDPSSPEGSEGSDLTSMLDNDNLMATPSPHTHMLSRTSSVLPSEPSGFSRFNSRSSTFIDTHMLTLAFQGSGIPYYQHSSLNAIQCQPDIDLFKTEDDQFDDFDSTKVDLNVAQILPMNQHSSYTGFQEHGDNITCHDSPAPTSTYTNNFTSEGEAEHEDSEPELGYQGEDNESDTEYRPSGHRRPSARRTTTRRRTVSDALKPSRVTKSKATPRQTFTNGSYITAQRSGEHKIPCVFSFAGCNTMWKTKNEWKRHAMTQHIVLESYHCKLCKKDNGDGALGNGKGKGKMGKNIAWAKVDGLDGQVFNRKDLFTQHVKRMHEPTAYRACSKGGASANMKKEYDDWLKNQQEEAHYYTGRQPLNQSVCPMVGCNASFQGRKGWDDRLEHVWKHFERGECDVLTDMGEGGLREWAMASRVAEIRDGRLVLKECMTEGKISSEEDAEGDYE